MNQSFGELLTNLGKSSKWFCSTFFVFFTVLAVGSVVSAGEIDDINSAIKENGGNWVAAENPIYLLPPKERQKLFIPKDNLITVQPLDQASQDSFSPEAAGRLPSSVRTLIAESSLPTQFDWRDYNGNNFVTPVRNQSSCSSCWAFAAIAALESKALITQNTPGIDLDLSEQILLSCSGAGGCTSGYAKLAADFLFGTGTILEEFYPYMYATGSCEEALQSWHDGAYRISWWDYFNPTGADDIKKAIYENGPVIAKYKVYGDFPFYSSGVYSHSWGVYEGEHNVLVVGWNDAENAFIAKNSWGSFWGESGYFKISYNEVSPPIYFGYPIIIFGDVIDPAKGEINFGVPNYSVSEADGYVYVSVSRTNGEEGEVSIDYETIDGNATSSNDYLSQKGTLVFGEGETEKTISIPIVLNVLDHEEDESFEILLSTPKGGANLGDSNIASVTIVDFSNFDKKEISSDFAALDGMQTVDIDGDGDLDVLASNHSNIAAWWENEDGVGGLWTEHIITEMFYDIRSADSADIDGDGDVDMIGAAIHSDTVTCSWWENMDGVGGSWTEHQVTGMTKGSGSVSSADLDGDGDLDLFGGVFGSIVWWENMDGVGGSWTEHSVAELAKSAARMDSADIDGDGDLDLFSAISDARILWWENMDGVGGSWTERIIFVYDGFRSVSSPFIPVTSDDIDGDGDIDILGSAQTDKGGAVTWWENAGGAGTMWVKHTIAGYFGVIYSVFLADMDGDDDVDVLGAFDDNITWWENTDGLGGAWVTHEVDSLFHNARSVSSADMDGDGDVDIIGAARSAYDIAWWENKTVYVSWDLLFSVAEEGSESTLLSLVINEPYHKDISIHLSVSGTAVGGGIDYTLSAETIVIPAGQVAGSLSLEIIDDLIQEDTETAEFTFSTPENIYAGSKATHTVSIIDKGVDADGDGYRNYSDCDDQNEVTHTFLTGYADFDGDTYTTGNGQEFCTSGVLPIGYVNIQKGEDCDDNNPDINPLTVIPGDVDLNGEINLVDAIVTIQVLSGMETQTFCFSSDINGDGKIGFEEVSYILQSLSGLRPLD